MPMAVDVDFIKTGSFASSRTWRPMLGLLPARLARLWRSSPSSRTIQTKAADSYTLVCSRASVARSRSSNERSVAAATTPTDHSKSGAPCKQFRQKKVLKKGECRTNSFCDSTRFPFRYSRAGGTYACAQSGPEPAFGWRRLHGE